MRGLEEEKEKKEEKEDSEAEEDQDGGSAGNIITCRCTQFKLISF